MNTRGDQGGEQGGWRGTHPWQFMGKYGVKQRGRHGEGEVAVIRSSVLLMSQLVVSAHRLNFVPPTLFFRPPSHLPLPAIPTGFILCDLNLSES